MRSRNKEQMKEYKKQYYIKNREETREKHRVYRVNNLEKVRAQEREHYKKFSDKIKECSRIQGVKYRSEVKLKCFTHYSLFDFPCCSYPGCKITDVDMLVLDHIEDNGGEHRKKVKTKYGKSGITFCVSLIKEGFPPGLQVYCANHNQKKEIERRRLLCLKLLC